MLEQFEVERALDWRKGVAERERKARWRGEDALLRKAVNTALAGRKRAPKWEDRMVGDLFPSELPVADIDIGRPRLPRDPREWSTSDAYKKMKD